MAEPDLLQRFMFERAPVRGGIVSLDACWRRMLARQSYPAVLRAALGELCAASTLLAATLKFDGALILQIQGRGPLRLLVVECQSTLTLRAVARFDEHVPLDGPQAPHSLRELSGGGRCALTLDLRDGRPFYQGIVPLEGRSVTQVLEGYMLRSEQIETRFVLAADHERAAGLLLQQLPAGGGRAPATDTDLWPRVQLLADTLTPSELIECDSSTLLRRLFHDQELRLFESLPVAFACGCSREKVTRVVRLLGAEEVRRLLAERGAVEVTCEFCRAPYVFDGVQAEAALRAPGAAEPER